MDFEPVSYVSFYQINELFDDLPSQIQIKRTKHFSPASQTR